MHCRSCGESDSDKFYPTNRARCKRCVSEQGGWYARKRKYGVTRDQYNTRLQEQDGVCAICQREDPHRALAVDHDHKTGEVRGLLCADCNTALGKFQDDPEVLHRAKTYLLKNFGLSVAFPVFIR
jgi:hypothetical protein